MFNRSLSEIKGKKKPRLLFFVTEDWYFCSHRLPLAVAARQAGYEVTVVTRVREHGKRITAHGLNLVPIELSRYGMNLFADLLLVKNLIRIYRAEKPDLVHHVGMKPVLYGSFVARLVRVPAIVNAFAGLGYLYVSTTLRAQLARRLVELLLRRLLRRRATRVIVQNPDDMQRLKNAGVCTPESGVLIRGSGVDLALYVPRPEPAGLPLVILVSRMLWDKGVGEFVAAAEQLLASKIAARFALVGETDRGNRRAVSTAQLQAWKDSGRVEWWGRQDNMPLIYADCHIVCLPTYYGEGIPKVLLEAAACGRPIVTTDVPGCREVVSHEDNGLIVLPRNAKMLAQALRRMIEDAELRRRMGKRGREIAEADFSVEKVVRETLAVYQQLLAE